MVIAFIFTNYFIFLFLFFPFDDISSVVLLLFLLQPDLYSSAVALYLPKYVNNFSFLHSNSEVIWLWYATKLYLYQGH